MTAYENVLKRYGSIHTNRCIDGRITGQSCCVGYCKFTEHPGFLTKEMRATHNCVKKGCHYYIPKQKSSRTDMEPTKNNDAFLAQINDCVSDYEGMKILRITETDSNTWRVDYITLTNEYQIEDISKEIERKTGYKLVWKRMDYDYEICARMIFS